MKRNTKQNKVKAVMGCRCSGEVELEEELEVYEQAGKLKFTEEKEGE